MPAGSATGLSDSLQILIVSQCPNYALSRLKDVLSLSIVELVLVERGKIWTLKIN